MEKSVDFAAFTLRHSILNILRLEKFIVLICFIKTETGSDALYLNRLRVSLRQHQHSAILKVTNVKYKRRENKWLWFSRLTLTSSCCWLFIH